MNYKMKFFVSETIPSKINKYKLYTLLSDQRINLVESNKDIKVDLLNSRQLLEYILINLYKLDKKSINFFKKYIIKKININFIYKIYILNLCEKLSIRDFNSISTIFNSFKMTGLIKDASIINNNKNYYIKLILNNEDKITFTNMQKKDINLIGKCHKLTLDKAKLDIKNNIESFIATVRENNELYGKYYHSFRILDGVIYDLAHNIIINYSDYIKLINPEIILKEKSSEVINNLKDLKHNTNSSKILVYALKKIQ